MHKRVLLPLDGSTIAEQALPHAVAAGRTLPSGADPAARHQSPCRPGGGLIRPLELGWVQEQACEWGA